MYNFNKFVNKEAFSQQSVYDQHRKNCRQRSLDAREKLAGDWLRVHRQTSAEPTTVCASWSSWQRGAIFSRLSRPSFYWSTGFGQRPLEIKKKLKGFHFDNTRTTLPTWTTRECSNNWGSEGQVYPCARELRPGWWWPVLMSFCLLIGSVWKISDHISYITLFLSPTRVWSALS